MAKESKISNSLSENGVKIALKKGREYEFVSGRPFYINDNIKISLIEGTEEECKKFLEPFNIGYIDYYLKASLYAQADLDVFGLECEEQVNNLEDHKDGQEVYPYSPNAQIRHVEESLPLEFANQNKVDLDDFNNFEHFNPQIDLDPLNINKVHRKEEESGSQKESSLPGAESLVIQPVKVHDFVENINQLIQANPVQKDIPVGAEPSSASVPLPKLSQIVSDVIQIDIEEDCKTSNPDHSQKLMEIVASQFLEEILPDLSIKSTDDKKIFEEIITNPNLQESLCLSFPLNESPACDKSTTPKSKVHKTQSGKSLTGTLNLSPNALSLAMPDEKDKMINEIITNRLKETGILSDMEIKSESKDTKSNRKTKNKTQEKAIIVEDAHEEGRMMTRKRNRSKKKEGMLGDTAEMIDKNSKIELCPDLPTPISQTIRESMLKIAIDDKSTYDGKINKTIQKQLECEIVDENEVEFDVLICNKFSLKNIRILLAVNYRKPILLSKWLDDTIEKKIKMPYDKYYLKDREFEKNSNMPLAQLLQSGTRCEYSKGYMFYISEKVSPPKDDLEELVESSGGKIVQNYKVVKNKEKLIMILDKVNDKDLIKTLKSKDIWILNLYSSDMLLESVCKQSLLLEKNKNKL